jgi:hypothetical protein
LETLHPRACWCLNKSWEEWRKVAKRREEVTRGVKNWKELRRGEQKSRKAQKS